MFKRILILLALLPALAYAQYSVPYNPRNVNITGGTVQGITTLGARSSGAAFDLQIGSSEVLTANRLLKFSLSDAARTITVPGTTTLPIVSQALTISGPTAARTITVPDASFTAARTDAANTFTGTQAITGNLGITNTLANLTLTSSTGTNDVDVTLTNTGGTYYMAIEKSTGSGFGATAYALLRYAPTGRVIQDLIGGTGIITSTSSAGFAVTGAVSASTQFNINGVLHASATAPTVTGFGTSPSVPNNNGTSAFTVNVGTGGTANTGSVTLPAAATGWVCTAQDVTTPASFVVAQTGGTTTTATFTNYSRTTGLITAWTASDVLRVSCFAY